MVLLKKKNPTLKVLLSLGGWGGCETCSDVFGKPSGIKDFAKSVKELTDYFKSDGIDLDWEYPAIEGFPGHRYVPEDKSSFTLLVQELRKQLGSKAMITFAAGGFQNFLDESIDWPQVMKDVDYVNLMTYDLVNGYSTVTGHHTALYSSNKQKESTDNAVKNILAKGIPADKLIIGAAFYGRLWKDVPDTELGLYQSGIFKGAEDFRNFSRNVSADSGYVYHWDDSTKAPFAYNPATKVFATFDDKRSVELKTQYAIDNKLGGIMFWELSLDVYKNGLLDVIYTTKEKYVSKK